MCRLRIAGGKFVNVILFSRTFTAQTKIYVRLLLGISFPKCLACSNILDISFNFESTESAPCITFFCLRASWRFAIGFTQQTATSMKTQKTFTCKSELE